ncbi:MFS transporter [Streptomyces rapamycinicus]|uniref:Metabolite transporter n=1 Tax=Streptomyces rapamycinicus (strain ATCC 29253 / DSM 41530 / NRRL 5491 / AYB-994) TaxID=1343740 RepID=A0A0A0NNS9_STRRN|nr:MFS transporter [Streptomyces rapamycinicus]AGP56000.1 metabolite transporter [Streptomyces rapamycinicus NRRL 5491]RLV80926.1 metabolite transporter [Streptomyces rapamycinicus NRRL 5491]UTO63975.1 MFS transporter [Streptomyces rapamycinicus]UTP37232.1 MFS transporter [Streptomyces rapamycinicus NRRL 5491]
MTTSSVLDDAPLNGFHRKLALYSSGGPFLDGYILSVVGVAIVQLGPQMHLSDAALGLIGASALIGIFFGAFLGGYLTDKFGRQVLYTIDLIAIIGCSVAQFWATDPVWLFVLRLLIGMAVGADYPIATSLLAEFTPRRYRGPLLGGLMVMWFVGAATAYVVGEALLTVDGTGWRWMLASAALPALLIVLLRLGTPESPRWLAKKGRVDEANAVMRKVFGDQASISDLPEEEHESVGLMLLWRSGYVGRMLFVSAFWTCSIVPLFAVYAFGPRILGALHLNGHLANIGSALITVFFVVGCVLAMVVINRMGRRALIIHSFTWSGLALLVLGLFPSAPAAVIIILFAAYAVLIGGAQNLQWIYPNELFPTEVRGTAVGLASSLSRIGAAIGTYLVPLALTSWGIGPTMLVAAAITLLGAGISMRWAPETHGLALHESAALAEPATANAEPRSTHHVM